MPGNRSARVLVVMAALLAGTLAPAWALPRADEPIDASKRAPISTRDAVRPAASPPRGSGVVGDGRIPATQAPVPRTAVSVPRASISVSEQRAKAVRKPRLKQPEPAVRLAQARSAAARPAAVPRLEPNRYRKILTQYRDGSRSAAEFAEASVSVGTKRADLATINRYADPRATLERQGIPVVTAGSASEEAAPSAAEAEGSTDSSAAGSN